MTESVESEAGPVETVDLCVCDGTVRDLGCMVSCPKFTQRHSKGATVMPPGFRGQLPASARQ